MGMISKNVDWLKDAFINKHFGQWSFILNRVTGVLIALYLLVHIYINSVALLFGEEAYTRLLHAMETPFLRVCEVLLITGVAFHTFNGIRILLVDFCNMTRKQGVLTFFVFLLTIVVFVGALILYWHSIFVTENPTELVGIIQN